MRRFLFMVVIAAAFWAQEATAQTLEDFVKQLGKELESSVKEKLKDAADQPCRDVENAALVSEFDTSASETWKVTTSDGRKFQVRDLSLRGSTSSGRDPNTFLGTVQYLDFTSTGSDEFSRSYRVSITYRNVGGGESALGQLLASAVNNSVQQQAQTSASLQLYSASGRSRDGNTWCLSQRTNTIDDIEYIP